MYRCKNVLRENLALGAESDFKRAVKARFDFLSTLRPCVDEKTICIDK